MRAKKFAGAEPAKKESNKVTITATITDTNESKPTTLKTTKVQINYFSNNYVKL